MRIDRGADHEPVGERVGDLPEARLDVPAAREVAVELVGERRGGEEDPRPPRRAVAGVEVEPDEDRDRGEARDRERVRDRAAESRPGHGGHPTASTLHASRTGWTAPASVARVAGTLAPPRLRQRPQPHVPARAARPRGRRRLLGVARDDARRGRASDARARPRSVRARPTARCVAAGYTAVGEFHYLGVAEALAAAEAAARPGVELVLLHVAYARGGLPRFRQESVARVPRPGRAAARGRPPRRRRPPLRARLPGRLARGDRRATPPPRRSRSTSTPTSSRARSRSASPSTAAGRSSSSRAPAASASARRSSTRRTPTAPSSTSSRPPARRSAPARRPRPTSATASCPPSASARAAIPLCIGSDSNVRIDPFEELRELEGIARRQTGRRGVFSTDELLRVRRRASARARSASTRGPRSSRPRPPLARAASSREHVPAALVAGCGADVVAASPRSARGSARRIPELR